MGIAIIWFSGCKSRSVYILPAAVSGTLFFRDFVISPSFYHLLVIQSLFNCYSVVFHKLVSPYSVVMQSLSNRHAIVIPCLFLKICITISLHDRVPNIYHPPLYTVTLSPFIPIPPYTTVPPSPHPETETRVLFFFVWKAVASN